MLLLIEGEGLGRTVCKVPLYGDILVLVDRTICACERAGSFLEKVLGLRRQRALRLLEGPITVPRGCCCRPHRLRLSLEAARRQVQP